MKNAPIDPLDPQLAALFGAARAVPPRGAKDRGRARLHGVLLASTAAGATAAAAGAGAAAAGAALSSPLLVATVALATATAAAVGGGLAWKASRPGGQSPAPVVARHQATPAPRPALPETGLGEEQLLVALARGALSRGDLAAAAAALERHDRTFPAGVLVEERETLWIVTLARRGDLDAARRRARRFLERHPASIHRETIEQATRPRR
jgi:hypothetical protein